MVQARVRARVWAWLWARLWAWVQARVWARVWVWVWVWERVQVRVLWEFIISSSVLFTKHSIPLINIQTVMPLILTRYFKILRKNYQCKNCLFFGLPDTMCYRRKITYTYIRYSMAGCLNKRLV